MNREDHINNTLSFLKDSCFDENLKAMLEDVTTYTQSLEAQVKEVYKDNKELFATNKDLKTQLKSKDKLLMEAYESIVENCMEDFRDFDYCIHCDIQQLTKNETHSDNCIVNKAQDYISKNKES